MGRYPMMLGVVKNYDVLNSTGMILDDRGLTYVFDYLSGQNLCLTEGNPMPMFTGHHDQPTGFSLREPSPGDPIVFESIDDGLVNVWGYLDHFTDLIQRYQPGNQSVAA